MTDLRSAVSEMFSRALSSAHEEAERRRISLDESERLYRGMTRQQWHDWKHDRALRHARAQWERSG
jgi:hypothetical protein